MTNIFDRIEHALSDNVEVFLEGEIWTVKVTEIDRSVLHPFATEADAYAYASSERIRLGIESVLATSMRSNLKKSDVSCTRCGLASLGVKLLRGSVCGRRCLRCP